MRFLCVLLALGFGTSLVQAAPAVKEKTRSPVVRLAPDFTFPGAGNKARTLRSLRGQPVVVLFAESAKTRAFRKQVAKLPELYSELATRQAIFVAVFTREGAEAVKSNIPFVIANNGAAVASAYGVERGFNVAIIGKDGNVDYQTDKVLPAGRIRDVIQNSFAVQGQVRK